MITRRSHARTHVRKFQLVDTDGLWTVVCGQARRTPCHAPWWVELGGEWAGPRVGGAKAGLDALGRGKL